MLQSGQSYISITSHMKLADASEWAEQGPLEVSGNLALVGNCATTPDKRCLVDASGLLPALFVVQVSACFWLLSHKLFALSVSVAL